MSRYTIGLDLGINNVGWAKYDLDKQEVVDKGVVRFEASNDAQDRRGIRSSRRLNKRRHHRVERIALELSNHNFNTIRSYEPELLEKRIKGLSEKLTEQEISNIIYYFAIHRGYIPYDDAKAEEERDIHTFSEDEYPCFYLKEYVDNFGKYRASADLILLKDNMRELKEILRIQSKFNSKINQEFIENIIAIISSKRKFYEGPGNHEPNQLSKYGRYRTLEDLDRYNEDPTYNKYLYEMLIGKCELSIDRLGNKENVAPSWNYYAEEFNFLNDLINIRIKSPSSLDSDYSYKVDKKGKMSRETIEEIKEEVMKASTVKYDSIFKKVLGITLNDLEGYRIDKKGKPDISKFEYYKRIKNKFSNINPYWLNLESISEYNNIIYCLTVCPSALDLEEMLIERYPNIKLSDEELNIIKDIKKTYNSDLKYHALSEKILKRAINDMYASGCTMNYMQVMKQCNYEKEKREYFQNNYSLKTKEPYQIEDKYVDDIITNPQVKKTLRKAIKVINKIMTDDGEYPDTIVIESAKEMNSADRKKQIERDQKNFETLNKEAKEFLQLNGFDVNDKNIEKVIYWKETNGQCCYCGKAMSINEIISQDVEHILPVSKTMDSTHNNLTCSCRRCNTEKSNRTPYEYLSSLGSYEAFKKRVNEEYKLMSEDKKKNNLLFEGNIEKYSVKFINRNLRDNAYASTALVKEINKYNDYLNGKIGYRVNVMTAPGQLTARIRTILKSKEKDRDCLYHHAVDAMILASIADTNIGKVILESQNDNTYWIRNKSKEFADNTYSNLYDSYIFLKNKDQIKKFNDDCKNMAEDNPDGLVKRSYEVKKNVLGKFADMNYSKVITIDGEYYVINQIDDIYSLLIRKKGKPDKDKANMDKLFDENDKTMVLLCQDKDPALFKKLKDIYNKYENSDNPFVEECKNIYGVDADTTLNNLTQRIRKTDNPNSPIVRTLRYYKKISNPYIKSKIQARRENNLGEFTKNLQKEKNSVVMTSMSQVFTRIYYNKTKQQFAFVPVNSICFNGKNNKFNPNDKYYKETYNRLIGNDEVLHIEDIYCGEWMQVIKKNGEVKEGRYKGYHKTHDRLEFNLNGAMKDERFTKNDKRIIIYTTDILGNRYVRVDSDKILC